MPELDSSQLSPRREMPSEFVSPNQTKSRPPSVTISMPPNEVYAFVRDVSNLSKFMRGFDSSEGVPPVSFERTREIPERVVSWRTSPESKLERSGSFSFEPAPGQRGTVVSALMDGESVEPGKIKGVLSYFVGKDPKSEAYINLRRLKAYLETGEVPTTQGQPSGRDQ